MLVAVMLGVGGRRLGGAPVDSVTSDKSPPHHHYYRTGKVAPGTGQEAAWPKWKTQFKI